MENIAKRLDFVIKESEEITKHFDKKELEEVTMFCMCILDRINFSSEGLKILVEKFYVNSKVDHSCGIIIRSALLDYLILLNAFEVYGRNLDNAQKCYSELKEYCLMMLCDSVRNTFEYFETLKGEIPEQTLKNMYRNVAAMNPICFQPNSNNEDIPAIKTKKYKSPKQLFYTLVTSKDLERYKSVYEAYLFYSKYDHFGNMFYGLSRVSPIQQLENIDKAVKTFPRILLFTITILESLYPSDVFIRDKREATMKFIDTLEGLE